MSDIARNSADLPIVIIGATTSGVPTTPVSASPNGDLAVTDIIDNAAVFGAISVSTTAVEAKVGASALVNRKSLTICPTNGVVYFGFTSSVTVATGTPISSGNILPFGFAISVFLIASATTDVRITEAS